MASLKQICSCIGVNGEITILHDFFGFWSGAPQNISVLTQVRRLQDRHVHMNFITVGSFTTANYQEIDAALQVTRDLYAQQNIGIGRIEWYAISAAEANGRDNIGSHGEAESLTNEWTVPNSSMDIFFVLTYSGSTIGFSRVSGPCDKNAKGMDGSVVAIEGSTNTTGFTLAHEAAHYLGLDHSNNDSNLMFGSVPNGGNLTSSQGNNMKDHCFMRSGC